MAYLIVVRGAGGSVNESGGEGEGVVSRTRSRPFPGEQRHESLPRSNFHVMVRCYDPNEQQAKGEIESDFYYGDVLTWRIPRLRITELSAI